MRLSLGALAEISERLDASGPIELGREMKRLKPEAMCHVLRALLRPVHGTEMPEVKRQALTPEIVSKMAKIFEQAFSALETGRSHEPQ